MKLTIPFELFCIIAIIGTNSYCHRQSPASPPANPTEANVVNRNTSKPAAAKSAEELCDRVSNIKLMPFDDTSGVDPDYDAIVQAGDSVVPCLIAKVGDTTSMPDPRMAPRYAGIDNKVGDVALWIIERIAKIDVLQFLPSKVRQDFKEEGVLAYFKYVRTDEHRKDLQNKLYEWYRQKYGKDAPRTLTTTSRKTSTTSDY